jgi:predicted HAD superfamily phosphohydrolase YqeG
MKTEAYPHSHLKKNTQFRLPDFSARGIDDIDFSKLRDLGAQHIMFDLDLTIRRKRAAKLEAEVITLLGTLAKHYKFKTLSLLTNNTHGLTVFGDSIGARIFQPFWQGYRLLRKPSVLFFKAALESLGAPAAHSVMIGDKLQKDIVGANRAGMITVKVNPRGSDYWYDKLLLTRYRDSRSLKQARAALARGIRSTS